MRLHTEWQAPLAEGRLLILSPFADKHRRVTTDLATIRNEFVAALADEILIAYAGRGSKTEQFCGKILAWGKHLLAMESAENANLIALGAKPIRPDDFSGQRV